MAVPELKYAIGNSASTTMSAGISNTDTSVSLTSDTNFQAKSGAGMIIMNEGTSAEELAYSDSIAGGALSIPLVNRGLEGGSAQTHASGATVKGILTAAMWNDLVDMLLVEHADAGTHTAVTAAKATITQTATTGSGLTVTRDLAAASTAAAMVTLTQDNAGDDQNAVTLTNDGTGYGLSIDQNGDGVALNIDSENTSTNAFITTGKFAGRFTSDIVGGYGLEVSRNVDNAGAYAVLRVIEDHANNTSGAMLVQNDGTGAALYIDQNGTPASAAIRFDGCTGSCSKSPETDAETGWLKVNIDGNAMYIPYYATA